MIFYLSVFCFFYNNLVIASDQLDFQKIEDLYYDHADMPFDQKKVHVSFKQSSLENIVSYYKSKYKIDIVCKIIDPWVLPGDSNFLNELVGVVNVGAPKAWVFRQHLSEGVDHASMLIYLKNKNNNIFIHSDSLGDANTTYFIFLLFENLKNFNLNNYMLFSLVDQRQVSTKGCFVDALYLTKTIMTSIDTDFFINNSSLVLGSFNVGLRNFIEMKKTDGSIVKSPYSEFRDVEIAYYSVNKLPLLLLKTVQISKTREKLCIEHDKKACEDLMAKYRVIVKKDEKEQRRNDFIRQKSWKFLSLLMASKYYDQDQGLFKELKNIDAQKYITYENNTVGFDAKGFIEEIQTIKKDYKEKASK